MSEAKEGVDQLGSELASFIEQSSLVGPWKVRIAFNCTKSFLSKLCNIILLADISGKWYWYNCPFPCQLLC